MTSTLVVYVVPVPSPIQDQDKERKETSSSPPVKPKLSNFFYRYKYILCTFLFLAVNAAWLQHFLPIWLQPDGSFCVQPNTVALTLDDGPFALVSNDVLDTLRRWNVSATFFYVGNNVRINPNLARRAYSEGHMIASHSYSHPDLTKLSRSRVVEELNKTEEAMRQAIGRRCKLFRPPYGAYNEEVKQVVTQMGYSHLVMWNVNPRDWELPEAKVISEIYQQSSGLKSLNILLHEFRSVINILNTIIPEFKRRGYTFVRLDECLGIPSSQSYAP